MQNQGITLSNVEEGFKQTYLEQWKFGIQDSGA